MGISQCRTSSSVSRRDWITIIHVRLSTDLDLLSLQELDHLAVKAALRGPLPPIVDLMITIFDFHLIDVSVAAICQCSLIQMIHPPFCDSESVNITHLPILILIIEASDGGL